MYSSLVLFHALVPSTNDQMMIFYEMMRGGHIPPLCMYWFYVVFLVIFLDSILRTGSNSILGLLSTILGTNFYFFFHVFIISLFNKCFKHKFPALTKIPNSSSKEEITSKSHVHSSHELCELILLWKK